MTEKSLPRGMIRQFFSLLKRPQIISLVFYVLVCLVASLTELFGIGLILVFIQSLASSGNSGLLSTISGWLPRLPLETPYADLIAVVLFLFAAYAVRLVIGLYYSGLRLKVVWDLQSSLMQEYFKLLLRQPYVEWKRTNSADLSNHLLHTTTRVARGMLNGALVILTEGLLMVSMLGFLAIQQPLTTLAVLTSFGLVYHLVHVVTRKKLLENGRRETVVYRRYLNLIIETFNGIREILVYGQARNVIAQHDARLEDRAALTFSNRRLLEVPRYLIETAAVYIMLGVVLGFLLTGTPVAEFSQAILLLAVVVARIMPSANRLAQAWATVLNSRPAVAEVLAARRTLSDPASLAPLATNTGGEITFERDIRLSGVTFTYPDGEGPAVADLDLHIRRGEMVGVIGGSGSGKTTLLELLIGLLAPQRGEVLVDGTVVDAGNESQWMQKIGYVAQDTWLIDAAIATNIAFGRPLDCARIERAGRIARLDDFVASLPEGYDTPIGERGMLVSGGQRRRIGIARALYGDPDLLVLDEATSALDPKTEEELCAEIAALAGRLTIIMVTHRPTSLRACPRVLFMRQGRVVTDSTLSEAMVGFGMSETGSYAP